MILTKGVQLRAILVRAIHVRAIHESPLQYIYTDHG